MYIYNKENKTFILSTDKLELPFYEEKKVNSIGEANLGDYYIIDRVLIMGDGSGIIKKNIPESFFEIMSKYKCGIKSENGAFFLFGGDIDQYYIDVDKKKAIVQYKSKQKDIRDITSEISDIEETIDEKTEEGKALLNLRLTALKAKLKKAREESESIALAGVERFGTGIISEF